MATPIHYADQYQPNFGMPWQPMLPPDVLQRMSLPELERYEHDRKLAERLAEENPVACGWTLPTWQSVMENWKKYNIHVVLGGNQCVHGSTLIHNPMSDTRLRIKNLREPHHVAAWIGTRAITTIASPSFCKGKEEMFHVRWKVGAPRLGAFKHWDIKCTAGHKMLDLDGNWVTVGELEPGDRIQGIYYREPRQGIIISKEPIGVHDVWDFNVPDYGNYICNGAIHSNSGKTTLGARLTVWAAATIPQAETYCFHVSEKRSIDDQQRFIYEALPPGVKELPTKKGIHHSMTYSQKNGFTDGICILPPLEGYRRGGSINFFNYAQYAQNPQIIEGVKAQLVWADERIPLGLLETLKYRLFTYHGRLLLTYTVIDGWNDTIEKILAKTRTLKSAYSEKLKRNLPILQESLSMDSCIIYYAWTDHNPFTDAKEFWKLNASADEPTILARAYGIPTKSLASAFPLFSRDVNVLPHDELPFVKNPDYPVTRYMAIDPGGSKNWCMCWVAIDQGGTWYIYREWPDYDDWALPGNKAGPAQRGLGKGIKDYVEMIKGMEAGEEIYERVIDPRMGAAERQTKDGATTIISDLDECDMLVIPAPGGSETSGKTEIEDGIQLVNNLLAYDQTKPRDSVNTPKLFVSDRCTNMIYCLQEFTGKLGQTEATKDLVDVLRYLRKNNCEYYGNIPPDTQNRTGVY